MGRWVKAADVSDFDNLHPDQPSLPVDVEGYDLVLFKLPGAGPHWKIRAPHEFSKLSEGEVWDDRVYCEKHGSSLRLPYR
jgi:hypothetical protein